MLRMEVHPDNPQKRAMDRANEVLRKGGVVIYPTDTAYALGCDIRDKKSLERIIRMKRLDEKHRVSFVCPDLGDIARYALVDDFAYRIMRRLLPGAYTFVLTATRDVPRKLQMKRKQVGIRVPDHNVPRGLAQDLGSPIVSTTAALDGEIFNDPDEVAARFGQADLFLDGGWGGLEPSTVVDLTGDQPEVLREGAGPVDFM